MKLNVIALALAASAFAFSAQAQTVIIKERAAAPAVTVTTTTGTAAASLHQPQGYARQCQRRSRHQDGPPLRLSFDQLKCKKAAQCVGLFLRDAAGPEISLGGLPVEQPPNRHLFAGHVREDIC